MIADSLLVIGDPITEQDQIDVVLERLQEEYSHFAEQDLIYGSPDSLSTLSANKFLLPQCRIPLYQNKAC